MLRTAPSLDTLLTALKAVADEKRLRIIASLAGGERCVCELQESLDAGQSLLSFHLKTLKEAGLVTDRREGRWVYYTLDREALGELEAFFREARAAEVVVPVPARCCD